MTRRDFELIAEVIAERVQACEGAWDATHYALKYLAEDFAARLRATNPRFDHARFMAACGFKAEG